eukprot:TRINITY_DN1824_c0_g1_i1.p1 TRINITY_DN1824_c0_g1~~TRINITY_DN1824_c0_g1_i1.p1  ORF type:complete len:106 (-),score=0.46 TRINITY_DN1824_c0_g1_i1:210-527(-)
MVFGSGRMALVLPLRDVIRVPRRANSFFSLSRNDKVCRFDRAVLSRMASVTKCLITSATSAGECTPGKIFAFFALLKFQFTFCLNRFQLGWAARSSSGPSHCQRL